MELTKKARDFFRKDLNKSIFCIETGMSRPTLDRRLKKPSNLRADEVEAIKRVTGLNKIFK